MTVTADPFLAVLGARRGMGDTRLDTPVPSVAARARRDHVLAQARGGNLEPAGLLLAEHRRSLDAPLVAELFTGAVTAACRLEFAARQDWLADFVHATVRDGRDGRILREHTAMRDRDNDGRHTLHLRPGPDAVTFATKNADPGTVAVCGFSGFLQRAPVGTWQHPTQETGYIYSQCPACAEHAAEVPETGRPHAGALPRADLDVLIAAHQTAVAAKLRGALRRRRSTAAPLGTYAAEAFPAAAVTGAVHYARGGGDARLKTFCAHFGSIELHARQAGYDGLMVDLFDAEFLAGALKARMPRRPARMSAYAASWSGPPKTGRQTWHSRRTRFEEAVASHLDREARYGSHQATARARRRAKPTR